MGAQKAELRIRQIIPKWASVHISPASKLQMPVSQLEATWQSQLHLLNQFNATNLQKKKKCCPAEPLRNPSSLKEGKTLLLLGVPLQNTWPWSIPGRATETADSCPHLDHRDPRWSAHREIGPRLSQIPTPSPHKLLRPSLQ